GREALVEERVAERALGGAVIEHEQLAARAVQARDDGAVAAAARVLAHPLVHPRAHVGRAVERDRLDEDLDGAAAREADLPRVLVAEVHLEQARAQDRKSTRLNSSHEWISYAVFCLKKKKKEAEPGQKRPGQVHDAT